MTREQREFNMSRNNLSERVIILVSQRNGNVMGLGYALTLSGSFMHHEEPQCKKHYALQAYWLALELTFERT